MTNIKYSTTSWTQEFALESEKVKWLLLHLDKDFYEETEEEPKSIGELITFSYWDPENHSHPYSLFQAEFYFQSIGEDAFAERGLISRKVKLQLEPPLKGIVLSSDSEGLLLRPEEMLKVMKTIAYQQEKGISFAGYVPAGREIAKEYRYLSPTGNKNDLPRIINSLTGIDRVIKTCDSEKNVEYEYWGQRHCMGTKIDDHTDQVVPAYQLAPLELVVRRESLNTGLEISVRRESISLARANGEKIELKGVAIYALEEAVKWFESFSEDGEQRATRHLRSV